MRRPPLPSIAALVLASCTSAAPAPPPSTPSAAAAKENASPEERTTAPAPVTSSPGGGPAKLKGFGWLFAPRSGEKASSEEGTLSSEERELGEETGLPDQVILALKGHGRNLRRFEGMDGDGEPTPGPGLTIDVAARRTRTTIKAIREQVGPRYFVFVSEQNHGLDGAPDLVSLVNSADPYAVIRMVGTNAANHDMDTDQILVRLKKWDAAFGLAYHGVGYDWLEAEFVRRPRDMQAFAREVYAFCPDVVDQGAETVEKLAEEMSRTNTLYLWWD